MKLKIITATIVTLALAKSLCAQTPLSLQPSPDTQPGVQDRRWSFEVFATGMTDVTNRDVTLFGATAGVGYYVLDNLAISLELSAYNVDQDTGDTGAAGVTLGLRHHLMRIGKASLFVDVAGGFMTAGARMPPGGTSSNTTFDVGPGIAYPIGENRYLIGGVRYFHLSNANREGDDRNPSMNSVQGFVGVMFRF